MGAQKIRSIRISVTTLDENDKPVFKHGGRYDLILDENGVPELSNEQIADSFAQVARSTVMHELEAHRGVSN